MPAAAFEFANGPDATVRYGAGIKILTTEAGVFVRAVTENSPADAAGLKPFDRLVAINGVKVGQGVEGHNATANIKGRAGDVVELSIDRGGIPRKIKLTIGVVSEKNVDTEIVKFDGKKYGVIRFLQFRENSCEELSETIGKIEKNIAGLILDLRDNPGGILDEGVCVAGLFLGKRDIVGRRSVKISFPLPTSFVATEEQMIDWTPSYRSPAFPDLPLVVLINQNSQSAAELVAGAIQDYKQGWLVGDTSFGKGSVQFQEIMPGHPNFFQGFTIALFYRPNGNTNQFVGVKPNFTVPLRRMALPGEMHGPREFDFHPNSIRPPIQLTEWVETRPEAERIRLCVESTAADLSAGELITQKSGSEDYQKAYALGVFACSGGAAAKHNSSLTKKAALNK